MTVETPDRIEPCLPEDIPGLITDLVADISGSARELGSRLHPRTAASLADLVRIMNCYYSNLIEGHNTRPRDIERALADDLDVELSRRNLQVEAKAHIRVQAEVDRLYAQGSLPDPASGDFICWLHEDFYKDASAEMLTIAGPNGPLRMTPGFYRDGADQEVQVGRHLPPSSDRVPAFMARFHQRYRTDRLGRGQRILAMAAAHHRLNYIHPFPDGNGRVSRLMSHAMGLSAGIGAHGLWSISRGLARGLESRTEYKRMMDHADMPRQGDRDGRGNLSHRALLEFSAWIRLTSWPACSI